MKRENGQQRGNTPYLRVRYRPLAMRLRKQAQWVNRPAEHRWVPPGWICAVANTVHSGLAERGSNSRIPWRSEALGSGAVVVAIFGSFVCPVRGTAIALPSFLCSVSSEAQ